MNKKIKVGVIIVSIIIICILFFLLINDIQNYSTNSNKRFESKPDMLPNNFNDNNQLEPQDKPDKEILNVNNKENNNYVDFNENTNIDNNNEINNKALINSEIISNYDKTLVDNEIILNNNEILVNSEKITNAETAPIYVSNKMNNGGTSADSMKNNIEIDNIVNINAQGNYEFSGTLDNGQIAVNANNITGDVNIILNNVNITCDNAPAIFVYSRDVENENCKVIITLKENSNNMVTGGKIKQSVEDWSDQNSILYYIEKDYDDNRQYYERYKYDGAISSDISLTLEGTGILNVNSKKEGIESKMHITINNGIYNINSADDGINACTNGKSVITINNGKILVNVSKDAEEGDGIDSNGSININGGTIYTFACPGSDNGLDSDFGVYINGGDVLSTGSMYEEFKSNNNKIIQMNFDKEIEENETLLIVDQNNNAIFAYKTDRKFNTFAYTSENLQDISYSVYTGKDIEGILDENNIYTNITSFNLEKMTKQENSNMNKRFEKNPNDIDIQNNNVILQNPKIRIILLISIIIVLIINVILFVYDVCKIKRR